MQFKIHPQKKNLLPLTRKIAKWKSVRMKMKRAKWKSLRMKSSGARQTRILRLIPLKKSCQEQLRGRSLSSTAVLRSLGASQKMARKPPCSTVCSCDTKCPIWIGLWSCDTSSGNGFVGEQGDSGTVGEDHSLSVRARQASCFHSIGTFRDSKFFRCCGDEHYSKDGSVSLKLKKIAAHHHNWCNDYALINGKCCMPIERVDRPGESQEATGRKKMFLFL